MELADLHQRPAGKYTVEHVPQDRVILVRHNNQLIGACLNADELIGTYYESYNDVFYVSFRNQTYIDTHVFAFSAIPAVRELCYELMEAFSAMSSQYEIGFRVIAKPEGVYVVTAKGKALLKSVRADKKTKDIIVDDFEDNRYVAKFVGQITHQVIPFMPSELFELPIRVSTGEAGTSFFSQTPTKYPAALKFAETHGTPGSDYRVFSVSEHMQVVVTDTARSALLRDERVLELDEHVANVWQFKIGDIVYLGIKPVSGATYTIINPKTFQSGKISQHYFIFRGSDPHGMQMFAFGNSIDPVVELSFNQGIDILTASGTVFNCDGLKGTYTLNEGD